MQMVLAFENELVLRVVRPFVNGLLGATLPSCLVILATASKGGICRIRGLFARICGKWRLPAIGADDERLGTNQRDGISYFRTKWRISCHKAWHESLKIAGYSPFDELILRRYFSLLDCAARTQSGAKQHGRSRRVVETTFSRRIASHSPFDWIGNCNGLPQRRNDIRPSVSE